MANIDHERNDPFLSPSVSSGDSKGLISRFRRYPYNFGVMLVALLVLGAALFRVASVLYSEDGPPAGSTVASSRAPSVDEQFAQALPVEQPTAAPTAVPSPTPDPDIRPQSIVVVPHVVNAGAAPVRIPGAVDPDPTSNHVIVVDGESGTVLFQRNGYLPVAPASLTKIMTAIIGIEHGDLSDHVQVDVDARTMAGSSLMGLEPWFDVTFQDLLYGLMLPSGNDAALAIARYVATTDDKFVDLMNQKARELGLRCTHFVNPHGLDASDHYSCPADMVAMARYAMQYSLFRQVVRTRLYDVSGSNVAYTLENVNPILRLYPGADGVKTGFTDSAGKALVATAVSNGHRVYIAFMGSDTGAAGDGVLLLNWAFNSFTWPGEGP